MRNGNFYASNGVALSHYAVTSEEIAIDIEAPRIGSTDRRRADRFRTGFIGADGVLLLKTVHGTRPRYRIGGGELYVRAVITDSDGRKAWTQPVFLAERGKAGGAQ